MKPSDLAKRLGNKSLAHVAEVYGCTTRNLIAKFHDNLTQFEIICRGVASLTKENDYEPK